MFSRLPLTNHRASAINPANAAIRTLTEESEFD